MYIRATAIKNEREKGEKNERERNYQEGEDKKRERHTQSVNEINTMGFFLNTLRTLPSDTINLFLCFFFLPTEMSIYLLSYYFD